MASSQYSREGEDISVMAVKTQNHLLVQEVHRLEETNRALQRSKDESNSKLLMELEALRGSLRNMVQKQQAAEDAQMQGLCPSCEETELIKQELFYSLVLGIKLNLIMQGRSCVQNAMDLYAQCRKEKVHYTKWNSWLHPKLDHAL
eukprot:TRINITY_DN3817_c0_g1_i7.p1 TRINITY_DN3817_c0_g1~~TRINITY_DN3817_c0_g1_i7.p1  ORF type:complete len:146 (-),score=25.13 TRINITY_DN3817_c0_g1_i7:85-522(-)